MAQATETFALGGTQVTTVVEIDLNTVWLISGNFAGTIPAGQVGFINGNVNLTGDLIVEGLLTGIDTFTLTGNGFQILVQHGGQLNLQGVQRSGWVHWGDTPIGWAPGNTLIVAPTVANVFAPSVLIWSTWGTRPVNSPNVTLPNGQVVKPEVLNLDRSIQLNSLSRIHFHDGAGIQTLKWLTVAGSGITGAAAKYPIHFHLNGESSRGSLIEGVVSRNGKNHAFVAHGSHGITFRDCVAHNTIGEAFWWDPPPSETDPSNDSNDILYDHCLVSLEVPPSGNPGFRLTAFAMGSGLGLTIRDSVAFGVQGVADASGFNWPESGSGVWDFSNNVAHNNKVDGIFTWQNDWAPHVIDGFIGYHNGQSQIDHGAYENRYIYRNMVLKGGAESAFRLHARGPILLEDIVADGRLLLMKQQNDATQFTTVRRCIFSAIVYSESGGTKSSKIRYDDCGLVPANFNMANAVAASVAEIYEGGVLTHRWTGGSWQP